MTLGGRDASGRRHVALPPRTHFPVVRTARRSRRLSIRDTACRPCTFRRPLSTMPVRRRLAPFVLSNPCHSLPHTANRLFALATRGLSFAWSTQRAHRMHTPGACRDSLVTAKRPQRRYSVSHLHPGLATPRRQLPQIQLQPVSLTRFTRRPGFGGLSATNGPLAFFVPAVSAGTDGALGPPRIFATSAPLVITRSGTKGFFWRIVFSR